VSVNLEANLDGREMHRSTEQFWVTIPSADCHQLFVTVAQTGQGDVSQSEGTHWIGVCTIRHTPTPGFQLRVLPPKTWGTLVSPEEEYVEVLVGNEPLDGFQSISPPLIESRYLSPFGRLMPPHEKGV
jgi:hypothetical protein